MCYDDNIGNVIALLDDIYLEEERKRSFRNTFDRKIYELLKENKFKDALSLLDNTYSNEFKVLRREIEVMMKEEEI